MSTVSWARATCSSSSVARNQRPGHLRRQRLARVLEVGSRGAEVLVRGGGTGANLTPDVRFPRHGEAQTSRAA